MSAFSLQKSEACFMNTKSQSPTGAPSLRLTPRAHPRSVWLCALLFLTPSAQTEVPADHQTKPAPDTTGRQVIPLRDGWRFQPGDDQAWAAPSCDTASWQTVAVPHDWSILGPVDAKAPAGAAGGFVTTGLGWYRHTFTLPETMRGRRVFVEFDGVFMNSAVWINGIQVGTHAYGYTTFSYDVTPHLRFGTAPNVLAVRVDNSLQPGSRWYTGSGIYRPVRLVITEAVHFDRQGIAVTYPEVSAVQARVKVESRISAMALPGSKTAWPEIVARRQSKTVRVRSRLLAPNGDQAATVESELTVQDFQRKSLDQELQVTAPKLWSATTPALYTLVSELFMDGRMVDALRTPIGIRSVVYTSGHGMRVNGKLEQLKGVCLHQDAGPLGVAFVAGAWEIRLRQLKAMGCNAIRTSHHPFAPDFLALCARLGIYVLDEAFDEWRVGHDLTATEDAWGKQGILYGYHRLFDTDWRQTLRSMIMQDRNHPCVVMYSIGNEVPDQRVAEGLETLKELQAFCHQLDPTRPVTMGNDGHVQAEQYGMFDAIDIAGYNYIDRLAPQEQYVAVKKAHPQRKLLGTETYYHAKGWTVIRDNPDVIGEFLWVGYDYLGESFGWPSRGWDYGMIDIASNEKPIYYHRQAMWSEAPVAFIAVHAGEKPSNDWDPPHVGHHWNWQHVATPLTIEVYSNGDEVDLLLNGQSLGRRPVDANLYSANWTVPFAPGKLEAIAYRGGQLIARSPLQTAGVPAKLHLEAVTASSGDIANIRTAILDAAGVVVPEAQNKVTFTVTGPGFIRATASGNLDNHEPYPSATRTASQGRCLAIVQTTRSRYDGITVTATTPGLPPVTLTLSQ
jgi:beta-galactosidase